MSDAKHTVIVAPHPDDEIIGVFEILTNTNPVVIYDANTPQSRMELAMKLKNYTKVQIQLKHSDIPHAFLNQNNCFYFPDPSYEIHPLHRKWGNIGESMARNGFDVTFYNTIMNAPYIHEVVNSEDKRILLDKVYPDQKKLWRYDHKYFLFEGRCKWIF